MPRTQSKPTRTAKKKSPKTAPRKIPLRRSTKIDCLTLLSYAPLSSGVFAGLVYDRGAPEILIAGPEYDGEADWEAATAWARKLNVDGLTDFFIPLCSHGHILQANVPKLFKPSWYWLGEQHASGSDFPRGQYFDNGYQDYCDRLTKLRARAVRRLSI